jgi:hypothetical protein
MQNLFIRHERNLSKHTGREKIGVYSCLINAMQSKIISNSGSFLEFDAISVGRNLPTFRRCVLLPSSGHKSSRHSFKAFNALKPETNNRQLLRRSEFCSVTGYYKVKERVRRISIWKLHNVAIK